MSLSYADTRKHGMINNKTKVINHPDYGKLINLSQLNAFLFGKNEIPITTCRQSLKDKKIIYTINNETYLKTSEINKYFDSIGDLDNQQDRYILINYYRIIKKELSTWDNHIFNFWKGFRNYLINRNNTNSETILNYIGQDHFLGKLESNERIIDMKTILFETIGSPITITLGYENLNHKYYINILNPDFNRIYQILVKDLLCRNPDDYILHNLARVTEISFAKLILQSYKKKNEFVIPIEQAETIIHFKSRKAREEYINKFIIRYDMGTIYKLSEEGIMLNFEGLNKYFLNLSEKYLSSFENKEQINTMYYNITQELIKSYQYLYEHLI